jgi:uncharacterized protein (TIGR00730 family)
MNVCVFCAAADVDERYVRPAKQLAQLIAEQGHTLVWGGSDRGLMRVVAEAAQAAGGKIVGITMESLKHSARLGADEMIVTRDLAERKAVMLERSDAFVTLVGGTGTLDELTEIFELKRHGLHDKPMIMLNSDGFYDGLRHQYERMERDGFLARLRMPFDQMLSFADTPDKVMAQLQTVRPELETAVAPNLIFSNEAA